MKCRNCGNKVLGDVKYCSLCGKPVNGNVKVSNTTYNNKPGGGKTYIEKKANSAASVIKFIVIVYVFFFVGIFVSVFVGVFTSFTEYESTEMHTLGDNQIPSLYSVVGEKEICSISSETLDGEEKIELEYCGDISNEDFDEYVDYLIQVEGYVQSGSSYSETLVKNSLDENMQIVININYSNYSITYELINLYEDDSSDSNYY